MTTKISTGLRNRLLGISITKSNNGSFTSDTSGWTSVNATLSSAASGQSGNCLKIQSSGGAAVGKAYQDIVTKIGHKYLIRVYHKNGSVGVTTGKFMVGKTTDESYYYTSGTLTDTGWTDVGATALDQPYQSIITAEETTIRITLSTVGTALNDETLFDELVVYSDAKTVQEVFYKGFIDLYTGSIPSSPDNAPVGTKLVRIYSDGLAVGISFDDASSGSMNKKTGETWSGSGITSGTIGWYRLVAPNDSGGTSTTEERIDGDISTVGASINLSSLTMQTAVPLTISTFSISLPQ